MLSKEQLQGASRCTSMEDCSECEMFKINNRYDKYSCIELAAETAMKLHEQVEHNKLHHPEFEWLKKENKKLLEDVKTTQLENDLIKENLKVQKIVMDEYRLDIERLEKENKEIKSALTRVGAMYDGSARVVCPECEVEIYYEDWPHNWTDHDEGCLVSDVIRESVENAKC